MKEKINPIGVIMGIITYLSTISQYISALEALQYQKSELLSNHFLELASLAMERQLTMDLCRIFDRMKTTGHINCCIETLEEACLSYPTIFPEGPKDASICKMVALREEFESVIKRETRNKKLAHGDLQELLSLHSVEIEFEKERQLYLHTVDIIKNVIQRFKLDEEAFCIPFEEANSIDYVAELNKLSQ